MKRTDQGAEGRGNVREGKEGRNRRGREDKGKD